MCRARSNLEREFAVFGNFSFNVKPIRDPKSTSSDPNYNQFEGPEIAAAYSMIAKDFILHTALVVGGVFVACKIIGRICK